MNLEISAMGELRVNSDRLIRDEERGIYLRHEGIYASASENFYTRLIDILFSQKIQ
ncbi:hypothetical protein D3C78_1912260 [compost metagenome]